SQLSLGCYKCHTMVGFTSKRLLPGPFLGSIRSGTPCVAILLSKSSARNSSRKAILASNKSSPPSPPSNIQEYTRSAYWFDNLPKHSLLTEGNKITKGLSCGEPGFGFFWDRIFRILFALSFYFVVGIVTHAGEIFVF